MLISGMEPGGLADGYQLEQDLSVAGACVLAQIPIYNAEEACSAFVGIEEDVYEQVCSSKSSLPLSMVLFLLMLSKPDPLSPLCI